MKKSNTNINIFKNKKLKVFIAFLVLSILFWFLSKLSKEYTHTISFKTNYINIANDKILQNTPQNKIDLTLKSYGFSFLSYKLHRPKLNIDLKNIQKLKNSRYYCLLNKQFSNLQSQISRETSIVAINPDTLFFELGILKSKKVKVEPILKLTFKKGFYLTDEIVTEPKFITIIGSEKQIDSITKVESKEVTLDAIFKNFKKTIKLKKANHVKYSTDKLKIIGKVEKFTEGKLKLDFNLINVNDSIKVSTFIKNVTITYKVSLKNFDNVLKKDFKVICDFSKTQKEKLSYLQPEFIAKSPLVSDVKISPKRIEYLIKK
ncbi:MAG: hypothetical protein L3J23_00915 [Flavobacteriaceae bacterium]|nr:hypothetical protein [Flavobacteriaceae bacterium]